MALIHSPRIVTDGLVFYYDMQNTKKSWRGKPTTNLQVNPSLASGSTNYGQYGPFPPTIVEIDSVPTTPGNSRNVLQVRCSTTDWGQCFYWIAPSLSAGTTYTISYYARTLENGNISVWFSNQNGSGDQNNLSHGQTITPTWQRFSHTATLDIAKNIVYVWGTNGATWQIADIQIEANNFATGFVQGTRSNTQAVVDLTGQNIITAQSLVYNTDGTFSFNGSQYLSIPDNALIKPSSGYITTEIWFKATATGSQNGSILINKENEYEISAGGGYITYAFRPNWAWVGATAFNTNQNYCVTITYDQVNQKMYLNGLEIYSASLTGAIGNVYSDTLKIGARGGASSTYDYFTGNIYNVKIYNRALSANEVTQNFAAQRGVYGL